MIKQALIVGGGSKFGLDLSTSLLSTGWQVNIITGSTVEAHKNLNQLFVNWEALNVADMQKYLQMLPTQDFIFFNQNSSALSKKCFDSNGFGTLSLWKQEKRWNQSYFISCILPFHIVHTLGDKCSQQTKVGWMLSSLVTNHHESQIHFSDYVGNKFQNYLTMKNFSKNHNACFFGINPDSLEKTNTVKSLSNLLTFISNNTRDKLNGRVFKFTTQEDLTFNKFNND
jgi:hypothetical protein